MHNKKNITILFCYEENCGGETITTESIFNELKKEGLFRLKKFSHQNLTSTNSYRYFSWLISSFAFFSRKFFNENNSFIIYTTTFTAAIPAVPYLFLSKAKLVFHYHGSRVPDPPHISEGVHYFTQVIKFTIAYCMQKISFRFADLIIVPAVHTKDKLIENYSKGNLTKIVVIPNGYDQKRFHPISKIRKSEVRKKLGLLQSDKILLVNGRLEPKKNISKSFFLLRKIKDSKLLIAYPQPITTTELQHEADLKKQTAFYDLQSRVIFLKDAFVLHKPSEVIGASDLVISFSQDENQPLSRIEARACDVPYYSTNEEVKKIMSTEKIYTWHYIANELKKHFKTFIELQ